MARVLIVDDDDDIRGFVCFALEQAGHEVRGAENGRAALAILQDYAPDLILLDMRMPVMDGWAFARAYRSQPGPHVPVIVLTAARDAQAWASEAGVEGYLAKPFELEDLMNAVNSIHAG